MTDDMSASFQQCVGGDDPGAPPVPTTSRVELIQISYSDLGAFHQCPRRYYYEKRLRMGTLPDLATTAVRRGTLMHTLLEGARDGRIDARQAAALFAREQLADPREQEALRRATQRVLDSPAYAEVSAGSDVRRERQFYLALRDSVEPAAASPGVAAGPARFLKGYIDIQGTRPDGSLLILDYKSGTRADVSEASYEDQARCYALVGLADGHPAVEVRFIRPEVEVPATAGGDTADPTPQVFILGPYTRDDYDALEASLVAAIHDMEQTGPDSPASATDAFACARCPVPRTACPRAHRS